MWRCGFQRWPQQISAESVTSWMCRWMTMVIVFVNFKIPVWAGVPRGSVWSWFWPGRHSANLGEQRILENSRLGHHHLFDFLYIMHFTLSYETSPPKKSKNKFRPGGNNTVGLHHPHLCSSTNLGESNTDCSQSRLCAYGTTTVCLKKWQYQWWENDNGLMLIRRHQTHKKTKTTRKAKRQRHLENTSKVIPETCDQALTRVKKVWE